MLENRMQLTGLCEKLDNKNSFLRCLTPQDLPIDSIIKILTVHAASHESIELLNLPQILHPFTDAAGHDYWKVFVDDQSYHKGHGNAYERYSIYSNRGASVIVRPDQYVSWVSESNDYKSMDRFFSAFMKVQ
jgi:phenol 2-monooxygenase